MLTKSEKLFREGLNLAREGNFERAISCFESVLEITPSFKPALYNLAVACARDGKLSKSANIFKKLQQLSPDDPDVYFNVGKILAKQGAAADALKYMKKVLELEPGHPGALCNTGVILARDFGKYEEAVICLEQALLRHSGMVEAHQALAICCHHRGDEKKVLFHLEEARKTDPYNPAIHNHLGLVHMKNGNETLAEKHFKRALELNPEMELKHQNLWEMTGGRGSF